MTTLKEQSSQFWSQGKSISQIETALRIKIHMPGGLAEIQKNFATGNFSAYPEMCFVQPDTEVPS